jgi:Leucine-rich repeat (LRR) protein
LVEDSSDDIEITPAHLAILDALIRDGLALSLKAYFIDQLPDVSPLQNTLIYFNLSFNNFSQIPFEIFSMVQLEALKLRNNPIRSIPNEISNLQNLKVLILSFCQIDNELPDRSVQKILRQKL